LDHAEAVAAASVIDHEKLVALDQDFHALITSHCGNAVLAAVIHNMSGRTVRARIWRGMSDPQAIHRTLREHRAVHRALLARDPDRARLHAALHVLGVEESLSSPHTYENPHG
ncbi:FCD domain-containing protein, partial [Microbispora sp. ZYX-F-249]